MPVQTGRIVVAGVRSWGTNFGPLGSPYDRQHAFHDNEYKGAGVANKGKERRNTTSPSENGWDAAAGLTQFLEYIRCWEFIAEWVLAGPSRQLVEVLGAVTDAGYALPELQRPA
jgi:hypothetical protein